VNAETHSHSPAAQLTDAAVAVRFILAGQATVTFVSRKSGKRFTYKVSGSRKDPESPTRFVSLLSGADNTRDYSYMGTVFGGKRFVSTAKSAVSSDAPSFKAFDWALRQLTAGIMPESLEIWHEGKCGKCGRKLTVPESIESGIGPVCARGGYDS
jgi:hypothetical protein